MAVKEAFTQAIHLRFLLGELGVTQSTTVVSTDSKAAISSATNESFSKRLKHVNVARQWVREQIALGHLAVAWVSTREQPADFLTKPLPADRHMQCAKEIGLTYGEVPVLETPVEEEAPKKDGTTDNCTPEVVAAVKN
jgi:hypothetical protein